MNFIFLIFIIIKETIGKSEEYYNCMDPDKTINSPSDCFSFDIPDSEGYKCCSMKILFEGKIAYSCFPLENQYIISNEALDAYFSKNSLKSFFSIYGGQMEIDCGENKKITKTYKKYSDEYKNCFNGHINGVKNGNNCMDNDIPSEEKSKCCFIETSKNNNGKIIDDKRCYIIKDEYFIGEINLENYLLDELNIKSLDQIKDFNVAINCKNYDTFTFKSFSPEEKKSGLKAWIIVLIVLVVVVVIIGIIILVIYLKKKKATPTKDCS